MLHNIVDKYQNAILAAFQYFWKNPETGYREVKTSAYLQAAFQEMGYSVVTAGNIPGFYADLDTGRPGPTVAILAELDALLCPAHPEADPETGAVHCCGHGAQLAALFGVAAVLKEQGVLAGLCGKIRLMAVPAEESIEIDYRKKLIEQGIIHYYTGKVECMYRGWFDSVDIAFMIHTRSTTENSGFINGGSNGCIIKEIEFSGVASHAGGSPHLGINALYAANLALNAVNSLRETFQDCNHIRFHPIITAGGESVNVIPNYVRMESYVRGTTIEAISSANYKINRAIAASAAALGANVRINDTFGYHPLRNCQSLIPIVENVMGNILGAVTCTPDDIGSGCTDMGDLSSVMPVIHPYVSGAKGASHGADYIISDPYTACIRSAKVQLGFLERLLENNAKLANQVISEYKPIYGSIAEYFQKIDSLSIDSQAVTYSDDNCITLKLS